MDSSSSSSSRRLDLAGLFSIPRSLEPRTSEYNRYSTSSNNTALRSSEYYSNGSTTPPSSRKSYESYKDYQTSTRSSRLSSQYSTTTSYPTYQSKRPFTSRFLKHSHLNDSTEEKDEDENVSTSGSGSTRDAENDSNTVVGGQVDTTTNANTNPKRKIKYDRHPMVLNNGSVIRVRREISTSDEEEESEDDDVNNTESEVEPETEVKEPTPEPEDPLDVEERELNTQLQLSFTLTLVDEENIRQRLLEIRKSRLRKNLQQNHLGENLVQKFINDADVTLFENQQSSSKLEEERILTQKITATSTLSEVEQKDTQVRLQELFRDRRNVLESCLKNIESTYEHILQETSTELNELESSIKNKHDLVEKLKEEILSMTVRKELLSKAMGEISTIHQEKVTGITGSIEEIDHKVSQYAVLNTTISGKDKNTTAATSNTTTKQSSSSKKLLSDIEPSEELREIERELECPVCMDIAKPPIYQCEEGHIICCQCKPLLTNCPHCSKKYSEPAIRCRFAEKLSDKYSAQLSKHN